MSRIFGQLDRVKGVVLGLFRVGNARAIAGAVSFAAVASLVAGCGGLSGAARTESSLLTALPVEPSAADGADHVSGAPDLVREPAEDRVPAWAVVAGRVVGPGEGDDGAGPLFAQTQRDPGEKITTKDGRSGFCVPLSLHLCTLAALSFVSLFLPGDEILLPRRDWD